MSETVRTDYSRFVPKCVTIIIIAQQDLRHVTLDFKTEVCAVRNHLIKGMIVIKYTRDTEAQHILNSYNLINSYFDEKNIFGKPFHIKRAF